MTVGLPNGVEPFVSIDPTRYNRSILTEGAPSQMRYYVRVKGGDKAIGVFKKLQASESQKLKAMTIDCPRRSEQMTQVLKIDENYEVAVEAYREIQDPARKAYYVLTLGDKTDIARYLKDGGDVQLLFNAYKPLASHGGLKSDYFLKVTENLAYAQELNDANTSCRKSGEGDESESAQVEGSKHKGRKWTSLAFSALRRANKVGSDSLR